MSGDGEAQSAASAEHVPGTDPRLPSEEGYSLQGARERQLSKCLFKATPGSEFKPRTPQVPWPLRPGTGGSGLLLPLWAIPLRGFRGSSASVPAPGRLPKAAGRCRGAGGGLVCGALARGPRAEQWEHSLLGSWGPQSWPWGGTRRRRFLLTSRKAGGCPGVAAALSSRLVFPVTGAPTRSPGWSPS